MQSLQGKIQETGQLQVTRELHTFSLWGTSSHTCDVACIGKVTDEAQEVHLIEKDREVSMTLITTSQSLIMERRLLRKAGGLEPCLTWLKKAPKMDCYVCTHAKHPSFQME